MPVYVYRNLKTNEMFEATQSMNDAAYTVHPETGDPVKRIIQPVAIAFKGSGFYVNDHRANSSGHGNGHKPHSGSSAGETAGAGSASASDGASAVPAAAAPSKPKPSSASDD